MQLHHKVPKSCEDHIPSLYYYSVVKCKHNNVNPHDQLNNNATILKVTCFEIKYNY